MEVAPERKQEFSNERDAELLKLVRENSEILRRLERARKRGMYIRIFITLLIIGYIGVMVFFLKGYVGNFLSGYGGISSLVSNLDTVASDSTGNAEDINQLVSPERIEAALGLFGIEGIDIGTLLGAGDVLSAETEAPSTETQPTETLTTSGVLER